MGRISKWLGTDEDEKGIKNAPTSADRQRFASRRTARALKDADAIPQAGAHDSQAESHLIDKLRRETQKDRPYVAAKVLIELGCHPIGRPSGPSGRLQPFGGFFMRFSSPVVMLILAVRYGEALGR